MMEPEELEEIDDIIEFFTENPEVAVEMGNMPEEANQQLLRERRENIFHPLWENTGMSKGETLDSVKRAEEGFLDEHGDMLPEVCMRLAAQEDYADFVVDKLNED